MSGARTEKRSPEPTQARSPKRNIRIVLTNIQIPFSLFVPIPSFDGKELCYCENVN